MFKVIGLVNYSHLPKETFISTVVTHPASRIPKSKIRIYFFALSLVR